MSPDIDSCSVLRIASRREPLHKMYKTLYLPDRILFVQTIFTRIIYENTVGIHSNGNISLCIRVVILVTRK